LVTPFNGGFWFCVFRFQSSGTEPAYNWVRYAILQNFQMAVANFNQTLNRGDFHAKDY